MMVIGSEQREALSAKLIFHVNEDDLKKMFREEIDKAIANIKERVTEYLVSHFRIQ